MVRRVACIGAGFVGGPLGTVIASQCPDIQTTVVDINPDIVDAWNSDTPPLYEPGLSEILLAVRERSHNSVRGVSSNEGHCANGLTNCNLTFSTSVEVAIEEAEIIFLCIDTPTKSTGPGQGLALDMTNLEAAVRTIARVTKTDKIIVEKSTVPCGTAGTLRDLLKTEANGACHFEVLSNPEFLSEGTIISDLLYPSRILIGSEMTPSGRKASNKLAEIYRKWVPDDLIIHMDLWSSELSKLAANALLAQRVSSINSLASICEETGADIDFVSTACGLDRRITRAMLQPSLGWGGGCFKKDIFCLVYLARGLGLEEVANYWASVVELNEFQKARFLNRIISHMHGCVANKSIAVLGFAFKKNTSDTKNSAAITLVRGLLAEGAFVSVYDPLVPESQILADSTMRLSKPEPGQLQICKTAYQACTGAEAVVVATDCDDFQTPSRAIPRDSSNLSLPPTLNYPHMDESDPGLNVHSRIHESLDWRSVVDSMQGPKLIFDGRNMLDGEYLRGLGCRYVGIGKRVA
ncbi:hypothetical protein VN97_g9315 [Penicillium thymicola]|uniref:UDP-glucose 6-dehydrogenase n=1 Tax=Penicillium thymicola TaxID=293382 RepID=A0AAI9TBM1_PENTH|nr:hypothetical protein VN97_g9315 [Penicillium thymicola]